MPRPGGESDKLGNRFEGIWTVDNLLDVFCGEAVSIVVEPLTKEALGVEFVKEGVDGTREFHSAKRQTSTDTWSLASLCSPKSTGRSILGDLTEKIEANSTHSGLFVSQTTANDLNELSAIAKKSEDADSFVERLDAQPRLKRQHERHLSKLFADDLGIGWSRLRKLTVVGITEAELIRRVEQRIRYLLYHPDGQPISPLGVRLLLGDFILDELARMSHHRQSSRLTGDHARPLRAPILWHGGLERTFSRSRRSHGFCDGRWRLFRSVGGHNPVGRLTFEVGGAGWDWEMGAFTR